jgi:hypothetical protein
MSIAQNFPIIAPSLLLDFANVQALDPRITFTRATTATYYGTRTALAEQNLLLQSQTFETTWGVALVTATANSTAAPDGTTTADTITATASTGIHRISQNAGTGGVTRTVSVFAKASTNNFIQFYFGSDGNAYANFNITAGAGAVGTVGSAASASIIDAGNGWYRCVMTSSSPTADNSFAITLIDSATAARAQSWTTVGTEAVFLWGAQLEQRSSVSAYTVTTTQPISNYIPVLETAASNVARFDHNPVTFESLGLLIEEQRTNLVLQSEDFGTTWANTSSNDDLNVLIAPNGTLTADKIYSTTGNDGYVSQAVNIVSGTVYTSTIYAKTAGFSSFRIIQTAAGGDKSATFTLTGDGSTSLVTAGATATITSVGNGWYRCGITYTATSTGATGFRIYPQQFGATGDGYSGIFAWGAQLEAGAFATSYIPTVASQVTRAADVATMTGANFTSWYNAAEGTVYSESVCGAKTAQGQIVAGISDGSINNALYINQYISTNIRNNVRANATDQAILSKGTAPVSGVSYKSAMAYKVNDIAASFDGEAIQTDTLALIPFDVNRLTLGNLFSGSSQPLNGHIKKLSYYPIRLSNTNLQALTS